MAAADAAEDIAGRGGELLAGIGHGNGGGAGAGTSSPNYPARIGGQAGSLGAGGRAS